MHIIASLYFLFLSFAGTFMTRRKKGAQPAANQAAASSDNETDDDEEEEVANIFGCSKEEKENEIAIENNKLKEQIALLEKHMEILTYRRGSSSNSSGLAKQIVEHLTTVQKERFTGWITVNNYIWRTNKVALPEYSSWQHLEYKWSVRLRR
jgi:outer membrane murein-binding lipoprotein Lpp